MTGADRAVGRGQVDRTPTLCDHLIISIGGQINCLLGYKICHIDIAKFIDTIKTVFFCA